MQNLPLSTIAPLLSGRATALEGWPEEVETLDGAPTQISFTDILQAEGEEDAAPDQAPAEPPANPGLETATAEDDAPPADTESISETSVGIPTTNPVLKSDPEPSFAKDGRQAESRSYIENAIPQAPAQPDPSRRLDVERRTEIPAFNPSRDTSQAVARHDADPRTARVDSDRPALVPGQPRTLPNPREVADPILRADPPISNLPRPDPTTAQLVLHRDIPVATSQGASVIPAAAQGVVPPALPPTPMLQNPPGAPERATLPLQSGPDIQTNTLPNGQSPEPSADAPLLTAVGRPAIEPPQGRPIPARIAQAAQVGRVVTSGIPPAASPAPPEVPANLPDTQPTARATPNVVTHRQDAPILQHLSEPARPVPNERGNLNARSDAATPAPMPNTPVSQPLQPTVAMPLTSASPADAAPDHRMNDLPIGPELRFTSEQPVLRSATDPAHARPEMPRHMAKQLAEAVQRGGPHRPVELTLNPVELGRVRISLQMTDQAVVMHVSADRAETLDLMRRHAETLAQDFHGIGYGDAQFSFSQQSSGEQGPHRDADNTPEYRSAPDRAVQDPHPTPAAIHITDRVDLRV